MFEVIFNEEKAMETIQDKIAPRKWNVKWI